MRYLWGPLSPLGFGVAALTLIRRDEIEAEVVPELDDDVVLDAA